MTLATWDDIRAIAAALPETREARIVAVTGYGQASDVARTQAAGFDDHLVKPVAPPLLLSSLARISASSAMA